MNRGAGKANATYCSGRIVSFYACASTESLDGLAPLMIFALVLLVSHALEFECYPVCSDTLAEIGEKWK